MKTKLTLLAIISRYLVATVITGIMLPDPAHAQIKLTYKNYLVPPSADYFYQGAEGAGVTTPSQGTNQTWDYSSLTNDDAFSYSESDAAADNPAFPAAIRKFNQPFYLAGIIPVQIDIYQSNNGNSFSSPGRHIERQAFSITAITGGTNDSIIIDWQDQPNGGSFVYQKYPVSYQSSWTSTFRQINNYELSVAAYGLDHVPGQFVQNITQTNEVVGTGKARVPTVSGPGNFISGILEKITNTVVDSIYLAGAPADPSLLAAFGLSQGETSGFNVYRIYRKGVDAWLLNFNMDTTFTTIASVNYDTKYVGIYCNGGVEMCVNGSTKCIPLNGAANLALQHHATIGACGSPRVAEETPEDFSATAHPNPSNSSFNLSINGAGSDPVIIRIVDLSGRLIEQFNTSEMNVQVGDQLYSGIYFIQISQGDKKQIVKVVKTN